MTFFVVVILQGSRWPEKFLLFGSRSQVYGVLPYRPSLQDQTHLNIYMNFAVNSVSFNVCPITCLCCQLLPTSVAFLRFSFALVHQQPLKHCELFLKDSQMYVMRFYLKGTIRKSELGTMGE